MPELPDLVHVEAGLRAAVGGKRIASARTGDPTVLRVMVAEPFPGVLVGRRLESVDRRGHFLRFGLEGGLVLVVNAMLAGRYQLVAPAASEGGKPNSEGGKIKKDPRALGLALVFEDGPELRYVDDKRMGKVYVARAGDEATIPVYGKLGVDVMGPGFTRAAFEKLVSRRRDQVRAFVMDKTALASIGNAYADEILFAAKIHPKTFCRKLEPAARDALYEAIPRVLREAIDEIRRRDEPIDVKVRDFLKVRGRDGKPCLVCGTTIRAVRVGDGDACFCPSCQPETRKLFVNWSQLNRARE
jgi:formamidopyrimidine-DNA glycosylase